MSRRIIPKRPVHHNGEADAANPRSKLAVAFDALVKTTRLVGNADKDRKAKRGSGATGESGRGRGRSHLEAEISDAVDGSESGGGEGRGEGGSSGHNQGEGGGSHAQGGGSQSQSQGGGSHPQGGGSQNQGEGGGSHSQGGGSQSQGEGGGSHSQGGGSQSQGEGGGSAGHGGDGRSLAAASAPGSVLLDGPLATSQKLRDRGLPDLPSAVLDRPSRWAIADVPGAWKRRHPPLPAFDPSASPAPGSLPRIVQRWITALGVKSYAPGSYVARSVKPSLYRLFSPPPRQVSAIWPALPTGVALRRRAPAGVISPFLPPSMHGAAPARGRIHDLFTLAPSRTYDPFTPPPRPAPGAEAFLLQRLRLANRIVLPTRAYTVPGPVLASVRAPSIPPWLLLGRRIVLPRRPYDVPPSPAGVRIGGVARRIFVPPPLPIQGFSIQRWKGEGGRFPPMSINTLLTHFQVRMKAFDLRLISGAPADVR